MDKQFMQILEAIGPEAMLFIIQALAQMDERQLQELVQALQKMVQQGGGQGQQQQQPSQEEQQSQASRNLYGEGY